MSEQLQIPQEIIDKIELYGSDKAPNPTIFNFIENAAIFGYNLRNEEVEKLKAKYTNLSGFETNGRFKIAELKDKINECLSLELKLNEQLQQKDARIKELQEALKNEAIAFAEWIGDKCNKEDEEGLNPFLINNEGRWIQACGNSTSWTTEQLYSMYKESKPTTDIPETGNPE